MVAGLNCPRKVWSGAMKSPEMIQRAGAEEDRLVSIKRVAAILGVCPRSVRRLANRGELPHPVKVGRATRMFLSDVDAYLKQLRRGTAMLTGANHGRREGGQVAGIEPLAPQPSRESARGKRAKGPATWAPGGLEANSTKGRMQ